MKRISLKFAMLIDLCNAADHHKRTCDGSCAVSIGGLKRIADDLLAELPLSEIDEGRALVRRVEWF